MKHRPPPKEWKKRTIVDDRGNFLKNYLEINPFKWNQGGGGLLEATFEKIYGNQYL